MFKPGDKVRFVGPSTEFWTYNKVVTVRHLSQNYLYTTDNGSNHLIKYFVLAEPEKVKPLERLPAWW